jgi:hypothetical protein
MAWNTGVISRPLSLPMWEVRASEPDDLPAERGGAWLPSELGHACVRAGYKRSTS